ncbi:MAG: hypothetical protein A2Z34_06445 [Planctomycetes bacterium RBG_16_59_8]|nr:MAG: hypothetical protein A2Z34_06445 [Planctomycetes bacterium RBG_16_59_8]
MERIALPLTILVTFALVASVQGALIDATPEKIEENKYSDFSNLPVTSALPTYIGSLFLGAFRAIAVDLLWQEYTEAKSKELYHEQQQIIELLVHLQPRNEETWSFLGWDLAFNLARMSRNPKEEWGYIRAGIERLLEGVQVNQNSVKLKYDIAETLYYKACWDPGRFQRKYLDLYAADREFQRMVLGGEPESDLPFEPARRWYRLTREKIQELDRAGDLESARLRQVATASGLLLSDSTMDIFIKETWFAEAMKRWNDGDYDLAEKPLGKAIETIDDILRMYRKESIPTEMLGKMREAYSDIRAAIPLVRQRTATRSKEDLIALLDRMEPVIAKYGNLEGGYILEWLSPLKREAGGDRHEFNDNFDTARWLNPGKPIKAFSIAPTAEDVDLFLIPIDDKIDDPALFVPRRVRIRITGTDKVGLRILLAAVGDHEHPVISQDLPGDREWADIVFDVPVETGYILAVMAASDRSRWNPTALYDVERIQ